MNQPSETAQPGSKPKIVVFCGHPCSGKSTAFDTFRWGFPGYHSLEMDHVRTELIPGPIHDKSRRESAYRVLHFRAMQHLLRGGSVALCATYTPTKARAELAGIAQRAGADLYVVQCVCDGQTAVDRFLRRLNEEPDHAGADLSVTRVRELANEYFRFDQALTIDTTGNPTKADFHHQFQAYLSQAPPVEPCAWALHWYAEDPKPKAQAPAEKLSEAIVRKSRHSVWLHRIGVAFMCACVLVGCLPLIAFTLQRLRAEAGKSPAIHTDAFWARILPEIGSFAQDFWAGIASANWTDHATWATFTITAAGVIGIFLVFYKETRERWDKVKSIANAGKLPAFQMQPGARENPSDREVYSSYQCRIPSGADQARMPIQGLPVYFLISPQKGRSFRAIVNSRGGDAPSDLPSEASELGLDWSGFIAWRWESYCADYALQAKSAEKNLRCVANPTFTQNGEVCLIPGALCHYNDYVVRELSVNLCAPGVLPDMRRLFDGPQWDRGELNLSDCAATARRYSLRISVTGILLTGDGYFVLQRRSTRVASGIGSLGASVGGAADFKQDWCGLKIPGFRPRKWNLENSIRRELKEETGITNLKEPICPGPFLGAAFNLRYGRDLNFYALIETPENTWQLNQHRTSQAAKDRWEVDRLEFLDSKLVTQHSILSGELELRLPGRSRHLMGALYAWTVFAGKK